MGRGIENLFGRALVGNITSGKLDGQLKAGNLDGATGIALTAVNQRKSFLAGSAEPEKKGITGNGPLQVSQRQTLLGN